MLLVNWRDTGHPEGGGSERYVERMAEGLARAGYRVEIQCAAYPGASAGEWRDGVRYRRRGGKFGVYAHALRAIRRARADLVVDVQNGMPFFARLVAGCPVLVLVHHVHKEQWISALGEALGRAGWWIESRLAPWLFRKCRYVTVSEVTKGELAGLGVEPDRVAVVPNGLDAPPACESGRAPEPTLVAVSRLVPHKRIEHAIDVVARLAGRWPSLRLEVVGQGPWDEVLRAHAASRGVTDRVVLHGWVDERTKHEILARSWLHLCPSVKEGWGIVIMEAAAHGVPSVAYRAAGGVAESIVEGRTGLLADDFDHFTAQVDGLLADGLRRAEMGLAGAARAGTFSWERSAAEFASLVREVSGREAPRPRVLAGAPELAQPRP
ncbi:glycosyltransferase family 4 protein [Amycolatopsis eburnea]|uniref:Glycosyltransferase family 1 protein n=1 Tax=Amycolatopsis eburnea TaxID=2267691 RepID=A0A3R9DHF6_9PSEU|nr:glycosyltransferase family 4 protein [Amycolatopsis eburnea]RSD14333.1 glycosyltransferase family 1 protein [Amycolatopsis eburnea]